MRMLGSLVILVFIFVVLIALPGTAAGQVAAQAESTNAPAIVATLFHVDSGAFGRHTPDTRIRVSDGRGSAGLVFDGDLVLTANFDCVKLKWESGTEEAPVLTMVTACAVPAGKHTIQLPSVENSNASFMAQDGRLTVVSCRSVVNFMCVPRGPDPDLRDYLDRRLSEEFGKSAYDFLRERLAMLRK